MSYFLVWSEWQRLAVFYTFGYRRWRTQNAFSPAFWSSYGSSSGHIDAGYCLDNEAAR